MCVPYFMSAAYVAAMFVVSLFFGVNRQLLSTPISSQPLSETVWCLQSAQKSFPELPRLTPQQVMLQGSNAWY